MKARDGSSAENMSFVKKLGPQKGGKDCSKHFRKRSGSKEGSKDFRRINEIVATEGASLKVDYAYRS